MPHFNWTGVTLQAKVVKGVLFAPSEAVLDQLLFKKEIALLRCSLKKQWLIKKVSLESYCHYFSHLALLINSGMLLPAALSLIAQQRAASGIDHSFQVADLVEQGIPLHSALALSTPFFDQVTLALAQSGQESGNLGSALDSIARHLQHKINFRRQIKAAMMVPIITLLFFGVVVGIMIFVIVPQFETIFKTLSKELPLVTRCMVYASTCFTVKTACVMAVIILLAILFCRKIAAHSRVRRWYDAIIMLIPGVNTGVVSYNMAGFFQAMAFIVQGGASIPQSIAIAKQSLSNTLIFAKISSYETNLQAGSALTTIFAQGDTWLGQDIIAMIKIGQESGTLAAMLQHIASIYEQRLQRTLMRVSTLIQPALLLILGLLIASLIMAVYAPIMGMWSAI